MMEGIIVVLGVGAVAGIAGLVVGRAAARRIARRAGGGKVDG
jgi:hypothetical protein